MGYDKCVLCLFVEFSHPRWPQSHCPTQPNSFVILNITSLFNIAVQIKFGCDRITKLTVA